MEVEKISDLVGGLCEIKTYCAVLAKEALVAVVNNYKKRIAKQA